MTEAEDVDAFTAEMVQFYKEFGVGKLGLHKAFRVDGTVSPARIVPITNIAHVYLDDLVGYEIAKKKLIDNTEAFVEGRRANNCLLFGDAGTGKSSSIKGILNKYYDQGLRIIEVYKHQFKDLVSRFGVTIFFCAPDKKQFQNIVKVLAERYDIKMPEEELLLEANKWELQHGGLSGRTAQQFIDYLCGQMKK